MAARRTVSVHHPPDNPEVSNLLRPQLTPRVATRSRAFEAPTPDRIHPGPDRLLKIEDGARTTVAAGAPCSNHVPSARLAPATRATIL